MPILPADATARDAQRAADEQERRAVELERVIAAVSLRLFDVERAAIVQALARAETDDAVRRMLAAIVDAFRGPGGLFRRAWTETLTDLMTRQYAADAQRVARETAAVTGAPVPLPSAADVVQMRTAAAQRAEQAAAEICATSAARVETIARVVAPLPAGGLGAPPTAPTIVADVRAGPGGPDGGMPVPGPVAGHAAPRAAVLQQRIDTLAPLIGRQAAEQVVDRVAETLRAGKPTRAVAKALLDTVTATPVSRKRAVLISRTEATGLLNSATFDAVTAQGILTRKRWITQGDDRVRPDHVACGREGAIPIADRFAGSELLYPGERPAPAAQTANCRCALSALP